MFYCFPIECLQAVTSCPYFHHVFAITLSSSRTTWKVQCCYSKELEVVSSTKHHSKKQNETYRFNTKA
jgi:hypothetical protein